MKWPSFKTDPRGKPTAKLFQVDPARLRYIEPELDEGRPVLHPTKDLPLYPPTSCSHWPEKWFSSTFLRKILAADNQSTKVPYAAI